jgi:hypothetical protein
MSALAVAVVATGYVAVDEIRTEPGASGMASPVPADPVADPAAVAVAVPPASAEAVPPASAEALPPADATRPGAVPRPAPAPAQRKATGRRPVASGMITMLPPATAPRPASEQSEADARPAPLAGANPPPAAAAPPQEPAPADRWQSMAAAIARCPRADFLAAVLCEQRVRLQYCEGYWGDVPECRGANRSDNGR